MNGDPVTLVILELVSGTRYFSDAAYISHESDDMGEVVFESRLVSDIDFSRSASDFVLGAGNGATTSGLGVIELVNQDGELDDLDGADVRDARVSVYRGFDHLPFADFVRRSTSRIDRIDGRGETTIRVVTAGVLAQLDALLQTALYATGDEVTTAVLNKPRPIAINHPKSCPIPLVDAVDYEYDCHDSAAWRDVTMVRDGGYPLTDGTGYRRAVSAGRFGIEKLTLPTGTVVADIRGASSVTEVIGSVGDFASGLTGWSTSVTGDGACTAESGGCRISGGAAGTAKIYIGSTLTAGSTYRWSLGTATRTSGDLVILSGTDVVATLTATGAAVGYFTADASGAFGIAKGAAAANWLVDSVRLEELTQYETIYDTLRYLLAHSPLGLTAHDDDSLASLDAAFPHTLSQWIDTATRCRDAIQAQLDSCCAGMYETADGLLAFGRRIRPIDGTPVATITADDVAEGTDIDRERDFAPGLSRTVAGARNWYRYGAADIVDGVDDEDRAMLQADYRVRARSTGALNGEVVPAPGSDVAIPGTSNTDEGIGTLLDDEIGCQALADHLITLYPEGIPRWKFKGTFMDPDGVLARLNPFDVVTLEYPRFGLDAGVPLLVLDVQGAVALDRVQLTLWGSPEETP